MVLSALLFKDIAEYWAVHGAGTNLGGFGFALSAGPWMAMFIGLGLGYCAAIALAASFRGASKRGGRKASLLRVVGTVAVLPTVYVTAWIVITIVAVSWELRQ